MVQTLDSSCYAKILKPDPHQLMNVDYRQAYASAIHDARRKPPDADVARDVVNRLGAFNLVGILIDYVEQLGSPSCIPIPLLLTIARNFSLLNEQVRALKYLDEAYRGDPDFPPTLLSRAQVLMYLGCRADSRKDLERCLRRAPEIAQAHWLRSRLSAQTLGSNHIPELRDRLAKASGRPVETTFLEFALHKELDDLGDIQGAWQALQRACRVKREALHYDGADSRRLIEALIRWQADGAQTSVRSPTQVARGKVPIFIVGMHRSGTTLLEQLLDASPQVRGLGELYDFTCAMRYVANHFCKGVIDAAIVHRSQVLDYLDVGQRYVEGVERRVGDEPFFTDKLPSNFLNIGFICRALPQAKVLHMVRDPMETCFSNLRELFSDANPYSYDQHELADYYIQYRQLMMHWHKVFPERILDVDYAKLTGDPETVMREVALFCGLEYVDGMRSTASSSRAIATASAVQVRGEVARRETPKWTPYRQYLQPLIESLRKGGIAVPS